MVRATGSSDRTTLRTRVVLIATIGLALTVALLTLLITWLLLTRGADLLDEDLSRQLAALDADTAAASAQGATWSTAIVASVAASSPSSRVISVAIDGDNQIRAVSGGPEGLREAIADDPSAVAALGPTNTATELRIADSRLRYVATGYPDRWRTVVLGSLDEVRDEAVGNAARIALAGLGCVLAGAAATSWALRRATAPLTELAQATEGIGADATQRVPVSAHAPRDVTALADEVNSLLARIEAQQRQRNTFLATVSHEIRTPLAIARGHLEAWREYGPVSTPDADRTTELATNEIDRAASMVSSLLTLARSEEPGFAELRPTLASAFASDLALRLAGIDAAVTVAPAPAQECDIDAERLAQAVLNAVTNAVIHNGPGVRVRVSWEVDQSTLAVHIDDDGVGWPPDVPAESLFEPFTHGKAGTSGLGMAVISAVARAHAGTVELSESPQGGARLSLFLPRSAPST